jgi:hypothetical protein
MYRAHVFAGLPPTSRQLHCLGVWCQCGLLNRSQRSRCSDLYNFRPHVGAFCRGRLNKTQASTASSELTVTNASHVGKNWFREEMTMKILRFSVLALVLSVAVSMSAQLAFYGLPPCRVADTRNGSGPLGAPSLAAMQQRDFPILQSACGIPTTAAAYSLNLTVSRTARWGSYRFGQRG